METRLSVSPEPAEFTIPPGEIDQFERDGYLILRQFTPEPFRKRMLEVTRDGLERLIEPIEYEADLNYPGAPESRDVPGGRTVRRLKQALTRDYVFIQWMQYLPLQLRLRTMLGGDILCPLAHHNCIMTKEPRFSSDTGWHQDIRYWSFTRPELVNVWLALGQERPENGCLKVIPGSHRMNFQRHQFDDELFFREDLEENQPLLKTSVHVPLEPGDVLFFHCRTLHAASRNYTTGAKYSVVFTFRSADNSPLANTRSAASPEMVFHPPGQFPGS